MGVLFHSLHKTLKTFGNKTLFTHLLAGGKNMERYTGNINDIAIRCYTHFNYFERVKNVSWFMRTIDQHANRSPFIK